MMANSPILAIFDPTTDEYDMSGFDGNLGPIELESLGALQFDQFLASVVPEPSLYGLGGAIVMLLLLRWPRKIMPD